MRWRKRGVKLIGECFLPDIIQFFSSSKEWIIALISGFLGSIIGAFGGGWATYYFTKKHTLELEDKQRLNLAKALETELSMVWERYMELVGTQIEKANEDSPVLAGILETSQNYFIVFDNSSNLLGLFDQDIIKKVIKAYINGKGLIDELIEYGKITTRYKEAFSSCTVTEELKTELTEYFQYFKERHEEIRKIFGETIERLRKIQN